MGIPGPQGDGEGMGAAGIGLIIRGDSGIGGVPMR